ncbi:hypothetical protein V494_07879, partial [Pseudogymnoascus sp. VKM F-4513 (FW-928)]
PPTDSIPPRHAALAAQQETARQRTERHDTNKRYGESISEHGFGGTTTGSSHTTTSSRTSPVTGTGISDGGDAAEVAREEQEQKQQRQGSYETSPEVEEREKRDRRRQGGWGFQSSRWDFHHGMGDYGKGDPDLCEAQRVPDISQTHALSATPRP